MQVKLSNSHRNTHFRYCRSRIRRSSIRSSLCFQARRNQSGYGENGDDDGDDGVSQQPPDSKSIRIK